MIKTLIVATSPYTHGGITAMLKSYENSVIWSKYHCRWIGTHCDGNIFIKFWWALKAITQYIVLLPFYDIVHIHFSLKPSAIRKLPFFIIARLYHKKTIIHLHCGSQIDDIWSSIYQTMFTQCDCSFVLSESIKAKVINKIGKEKNIRVIYNPCPTITYKTKYEKKDHILFSGTICEGKGYKDLIRAFAKIADKYPNWKLVLAGNGEVDNANSLAQKLGIEKQVITLGWVEGEKKHKVYSEAKVLCHPSYAEGFPMAVLDAWAYELPVVCTPIGGIPDVAVDGENILLFDPGNINKLSQCLDRIISDEKLRGKIAQNSKHLASTTFNLDTITKQIGDIYEELMTCSIPKV